MTDLTLRCVQDHHWRVELERPGPAACAHGDGKTPLMFLCPGCGSGTSSVAILTACPRCGGVVRCARCAASVERPAPPDPRCPSCGGRPVGIVSAPAVTVRGEGWERVC